MRRVAIAAMLTATMAVTGACSDSDQRRTAPPATTASGPVATTQQFDRAFPVSGENWDATVTLSNLRIVPTSAYADTVFALDVRVVQSAGQPEFGPDSISAYAPSGDEYVLIESPAGLVNDPLVPSVLTSPGQEIQGMVAWRMPEGARIGRVEVTTPGTKASVTVTLQPVDPSAQPADAVS